MYGPLGWLLNKDEEFNHPSTEFYAALTVMFKAKAVFSLGNYYKLELKN